MVMEILLQEAKKLEVESYKSPSKIKNLRKTHVPFTGSPQQHPYDSERVILVADPYSSNTLYYEFRTADISFVEELPNIATLDGETVTMVRIWVTKKSIGVRSSPFVVEDILF